MAYDAATEQRLKDLQVSVVRGDGRLERHCEHGIGHTVGHISGKPMSRWDWVHGCDGCCKDYPTGPYNIDTPEN